MQADYILIVPSWYPTKEKPIIGIFIKKHVDAISTFRNVKVVYAAGGNDECLVQEQESESSSSIIAYYVESANRRINQVKYLLAMRKAYLATVEQYGKPKAIHLQVAFPAGLFVYLLLQVLNVPVIVTEHWSGYTDADGRYEKMPGMMKTVVQKLFGRAKAISVVSEYLKTVIGKKSPINSGKIVITNNVLQIPKEVRLSPEPINTIKGLFIGNLNDHEKNISLLINATAIVVKQHPQFRLTIVGGGNDLERYKKLASEKGLLDSVIQFTGFLPNNQLGDIYAQHHFYMLTSNFETFSIAAAEAILNGLPVVSTRCGGPAEFIHENNGVWIEEISAAGIAEAMGQMIDNYSSYKRMEMAQAMAAKYSKTHIIEQLENLYHISGV